VVVHHRSDVCQHTGLLYASVHQDGVCVQEEGSHEEGDSEGQHGGQEGTRGEQHEEGNEGRHAGHGGKGRLICHHIQLAEEDHVSEVKSKDLYHKAGDGQEGVLWLYDHWV